MMYWDVTVVLEFVQVNGNAIYIEKIQQLKWIKNYNIHLRVMQLYSREYVEWHNTPSQS